MSEIYIPYETSAREIAKEISFERLPTVFPNKYRILIEEILTEAVHDGIEFAQAIHEPIAGVETQGQIYLKGYIDGLEDATRDDTK